ncbi:hypothetical protein G7Y89_g7121 [Cudoniella acicularis]|uniref:PNPLA domain-containing protein n=1 Tax=Cudoniella acicularis TaxID=354080 RepID=A0A8H4RL09_9HELO|nr:hypothetical protein G7Y89_g7121 [Cudoniella acicularis]
MPPTTTDQIAPIHKPLRILSLDGGGVRGIGSLYILRELMSQTVDQTIVIYKALAEKVFTSSSSNIDAQFDHILLEKIIKDAIVQAPVASTEKLSSDEMMEDCTVDEEAGGCRTFVVAIRTRGGNQAARLRTYGNDEAGPFEGRIWEAARATSAAPTFFSPIQVEGVKWGDAGTGWNNPTREAMYEARMTWPNRPIGCLISLGTGEGLPTQLVEAENLPGDGLLRNVFNNVAARQSFLLEVAKYCKDCLTSCKTVHEDVLENQDAEGLGGRYFRFNTPGMGGIGLEEWKRISDMIALTQTYMESRSVRYPKLQAAGLLVHISRSRLHEIAMVEAESSGSTDQRRVGRSIESGAGSSIHTLSENPLSDLPVISPTYPVAALVHVASDFGRVSASFKALIRHGSEFDNLWIFMDSIKVGFRLECANLLALVESSARLSDFDSLDLMGNPDEKIPLRQRTTTTVQNSIINILGLVEENLNSLRASEQRLSDLLQKRQAMPNDIKSCLQKCIASAKDTVSQLKKHKSCLTNVINKVRADLQHLDDSFSSKEEGSLLAPEVPSHIIDQRLRDLKIVQRTSTKLYEALGKICIEHRQHSAHFRLHQHFNRKDSRGNSYIPFELRFCSYNMDSSDVYLLGAAWIAIESFFPRHLGQNQSISEQCLHASNMRPQNCLKPSLERPIMLPECPCQNKQVKISHMRSTFSDSGYETSVTSLSVKKSETKNSKPDFCLRRDFCTRFQAYGQDTCENPGRFIGYLEKTDEFNHRVSFSPRSVELGDEEPVSLADMFAVMDIKRPESTTPYIPYERVELAKQLASAMLQFQGTPLLNSVWGSKDVMFFKHYRNSINARQAFKSPYLLVEIQNDQQKQRTSSSSPLCETVVYNRCLFSLAITLIEVAYQSPILQLRVESELVDWEDCEETNDHALLALAMRLQGSLSAELGGKYQRIVGKCLQACRDRKFQDFEERSFRAEIFTGIIIQLEDLQQVMTDEAIDGG